MVSFDIVLNGRVEKRLLFRDSQNFKNTISLCFQKFAIALCSSNAHRSICKLYYLHQHLLMLEIRLINEFAIILAIRIINKLILIIIRIIIIALSIKYYRKNDLSLMTYILLTQQKKKLFIQCQVCHRHHHHINHYYFRTFR